VKPLDETDDSLRRHGLGEKVRKPYKLFWRQLYTHWLRKSVITVICSVSLKS
jgi:hypothetical protein